MNHSKRFFFRPDIRSLLVVSSSYSGCFASRLSLARFCRGKSCPFVLTRWYETEPFIDVIGTDSWPAWPGLSSGTFASFFGV